MSNKKILVTSGLLYANGPLHLGHMLELIQTDIWVRFQKSQKNDCKYICGEDAHGTPIMLRAQKEGISPEELIKRYYDEHLKDIQDFHVNVDNYHTTHSKENKELAEEFYLKLKANNDIEEKTITQAYDSVKEMFLPDRYVKGTCPKCSAEDQHGDSCEACGATYSPTDLINAKSVVSDTTPITKDSEHDFFVLENYREFLQDWLNGENVQEEVKNKLMEWFNAGLQKWDITRDKPYFGFEIPGKKDKFFYVWMDAPIGYIASFKNFCEKENVNFEEYWKKDSDVELYHFIGKDIIYFHSIFWPAMLKGANYRLPSSVYAHGFLTINGQKMSKSKGTFITARNYLEHLPADCLRYYLASKLNSGIDDIDLNLEDFTQKVNSDLVGKLINIASRCANFVNKNFNSTLAKEITEKELWNTMIQEGEEIAKHYQERKYNKAIKSIMSLTAKANQYIDANKPWELVKTDKEKVLEVCSNSLNLFKILIGYLSFVTPKLKEDVEEFLNCKLNTWEEIQAPLLNHKINKFKPLMKRIEDKKVSNLVEAPKEETKEAKKEEANYINIDDLMKVDLRIGQIKKAEHIEEAEKLLKLSIDVGEEKPRQIFAGIKAAYAPEDLVNKMVVVVANLAPRKMRFGISEGMVLAAGPGGKDLWTVSPDTGAKPGMQVK